MKEYIEISKEEQIYNSKKLIEIKFDNLQKQIDQLTTKNEEYETQCNRLTE